MSGLDKLGGLVGTDKHSSAHDYLRIYEGVFARFRDEPITVLEMGVAMGQSLRMWRAYFPQARIVGFDKDERCARFAREDNIIVEIGDQSKEEDLLRLAAKYAPFGIIIDDAGHEPESQLFAYRTLFPQLLPGGIYCLEDIGVLEPWEDRSVGEFFNRLSEQIVYAPMDYRQYDQGTKKPDGVDPFILEWAPKIASLTIAQKLAVTVRK